MCIVTRYPWFTETYVVKFVFFVVYGFLPLQIETFFFSLAMLSELEFTFPAALVQNAAGGILSNTRKHVYFTLQYQLKMCAVSWTGLVILCQLFNSLTYLSIQALHDVYNLQLAISCCLSGYILLFASVLVRFISCFIHYCLSCLAFHSSLFLSYFPCVLITPRFYMVSSFPLV